MSAEGPVQATAIPNLDDILKKKINHDVEEHSITVWDKGVFLSELQRHGIVLATGTDGKLNGRLCANRGLKMGTYKGTQLALTEIYSLIEESAASYFDSRSFEPIIPQRRDLKQKQKLYSWSSETFPPYPPHIETLPPNQMPGPGGVGQIFDSREEAFVTAVAEVFSFIIPDQIAAQGTPFEGPTLADCEIYNREHPNPNTDIMDGKNIGDLEDWFSDARFAQQHLSGVNPSTIQTAPRDMVNAYVNEAGNQGLESMKNLLRKGQNLLVQDYSYFREATGVSNEDEFVNLIEDVVPQQPIKVETRRYACAPVVIFQLHSDGRLHPLAITLDYKGGLDHSITIFNQRLTPDDRGVIDEKDDWPWRYAKTCAQTADWARHEIAVHLVDTHMIEEAIIVATNIIIPESHLLYQILSPHWYRTLALNVAARKTLVPGVIARLSGLGSAFDPKTGTSPLFNMINYSYKNFNFQDKYIPNDLKKRGFDLSGGGNMYRNYPYAIDMWFFWMVIRAFVTDMLAIKYRSDKDVQDDAYIASWCTEIQTNGQIASFPTITTLDQLIDAVTMCIHTASPQHTAVNYLQQYYYSFVPSKPPALCTPLPRDLKTLQGYTEKDLTLALPIGSEDAKWKDWLLAAQLPELLSYKVDNKYNLLTYARSLYEVNKNRTAAEREEFHSDSIMEAARLFYSRLIDLGKAFEFVSADQTPGTIEYKVLQPDLTAVSILI